MGLRRLLAMLGVAVLVLSATVGTAGFTSGTLEREVEVAVETGDDAYLGIESHAVTAEPGQSTAPVLTVRNDFAGDVRLRVDASVDTPSKGRPPKLLELTPPPVVGVGETGTVHARVVCGGTERSETFAITATVTGPDVETTFTRKVTVTCSGASSAGTPPGNSGGN
jgi:hypothetical protein